MQLSSDDEGQNGLAQIIGREECEQEQGNAEPVTPRLYDVIRGFPSMDINDHFENDSFHRNAFLVLGGHIYLDSVVFFGPAKADSASYRVTLFVETPAFQLEYPWYYHCMPWLQKFGDIYASYSGTVTVEKGSLMNVKFDKPIKIPPNKWIGITFSIQGRHPTARITLGGQLNEIEVDLEGGQVRKFQFLTGSRQMPIIRFTL